MLNLTSEFQYALQSERHATTFRNLPVLLRRVVSPDPLNGGPPLLAVCYFPIQKTPAATTHDCGLPPPSTT
jgi:hypothetical protein